MEKFSEWRDKGTGISPFMPADERPNVLVASALFIAKAPLVLFFVVATFIWRTPKVLYWALKLLFGIRRIEITVEGVKRSAKEEIYKNLPDIGDFVICNFTSPIDGLVLASMAKVNWDKIVILVPNKDGVLFQYSIWSLMKCAVTPTIGINTSSTKIDDYDQLRNKLVYCFIEGTPSNNKAILPFVNIGPVPSNSFNVKTLLLKLMPNALTTPLPVSLSSYFMSTIANTSKSSYIRVRIFNHHTRNSQRNFDLKLLKSCFESSQLNIIGSDLNIDQKIKFYVYYTDYNIKKLQ